MRDRLSTRTSGGGGLSTPQGVSPRINTSVARKSLASGDVDITAIYTECIKLSATNKINTKNAFGLKLIDYMSYFIKHKPDEQINFKLVSSALDAGSKIYGNRVDCVHAEAQKVASGLVIVLDKDKDGDRGGRSAGDDEDVEMDGERGPEEGGNRTKKRKTNKRTVKTIANNLDTITSKSVESIPPPDPLFSLLSSSFDIGNVTGLLVPNLNHEDDGLLLLTQSNFQMDQEYADIGDVTLVSKNFQAVADSRAQIVPNLSRFEFLTRDGDQNASMSTLRATAESRMTQFDDNRNDDLDYDSANCADFCDDPAMSDNASSAGDPQENTVIDNNRCESFVKLDSDNATDYLLKIFTADEQSDYTTPFHKDLDGIWAGPEFLKSSRLAQKKSQQNSEATKSVRKPKAQYKEIDFSQPIPGEDDPKIETKLKTTTLMKWTERLLPDDISYDPVNLLKPFLKENATFSALKLVRTDPSKTLNGADNMSDDGRASPMDAGMDADNYGDDYPSEIQGFPTQGFTQDIGAGDTSFTGNNLIDEPFLVSQTQLPFSTVAKKIDVKKLKKEMWIMLTPDQQPNTESSTEQPPNEPRDRTAESPSVMSPNKTLPFSDMYKKLPDKVGTSMANNLSVPIAFVALLHLTNEKNLELEGNSDLSDFIIKPPSAS